MSETQALPANGRGRLRFGLVILLVGLVVYILGAAPAIMGLDRSPVTGFVQIAVFLGGLGLICIGGYSVLNQFWKGTEKSIAADIGLRLVSTGYVISFASGLADVFGFGSHPFRSGRLPSIPYFGPLQATGVLVGEIVIIIGFLLLIRYPRQQHPEEQE
jgi:hypothetical protein